MYGFKYLHIGIHDCDIYISHCISDYLCNISLILHWAIASFWILYGVLPTGLSVSNATVSLQSLKVLSFIASVTVFFHQDDSRLLGRLHIVRATSVPFLEESLRSLRTSARATEASWVHFFCGSTTYPRILLWLDSCLFSFQSS